MIFAGHMTIKEGSDSAITDSNLTITPVMVFAAVSLANMFANVSCMSVLIGMSGAVETLASQSNGAGIYLSIYLSLHVSNTTLYV
jgi:hypothetical protein